MVNMRRRSVLKALGAAAPITAGLQSVPQALAEQATTGDNEAQLQKLGHSLLSDPPGGYTEGDIRPDGQYGVLGSYIDEGGSFLVDLSDLEDPTETHRLPSSAEVRNADVKFDPRDGLYYRSQEPNAEDVDFAGIEVIDYGYEEGTLEEPEIIATLDAGPTHNLFPHPEEPVLYTTNEADSPASLGVWDVSDPWDVEKIGDFGPEGADLHDVVVDPERELAHLAFIGAPEQGVFDGYVIMDVSDPAEPQEAGRFSYADELDYSEVPIGQEAFTDCHYADYDPEREIAVIGDEIGTGNPGGKHIFDIGWDEGSPENPVPVGFTLSPNAQFMNADPNQDGEAESTQTYDWTTHNHDVVPMGDATYLTSGDYHEGTVLYDITDPTDPEPIDQYMTDDDADEADGPESFGDAPMAWGADYNAERNFVFTSDMFTGAYTFQVTDDGDDHESHKDEKTANKDDSDKKEDGD